MTTRRLLDFDPIEPLDGFAPVSPSHPPQPANDNRPIPRQLDRLFTAALDIEAQAAQEAGALGFMARALVQATMPHKAVLASEFERTNGAFTMTMVAPSKVGLPYGSIPRLIIGFLTTEAVRTRDRHIVLGSSLSRFMAELDLAPTGGRWGSIPRLKDQMTRLVSCSISCTYTAGNPPLRSNDEVLDVHAVHLGTKLPEHYYVTPEPVIDSAERIEHADAFFTATEADIRHGGGKAYYSGGTDHVQMPVFESFMSPEAYYATLAHELTHWTKHTSRLDRDFGRKAWGDEGYAREELVAELGAAFLCADLGLTPEPAADHAAYIQSWLKVLKNDKRAIFAAAAHAQRAADYLHGLQPLVEEVEEVAA